MAFLESLGESISHAGSAITQRANDFTLQNQLKHSIEQCQQRIDSDYRTLGTMVYMERKHMSQEPMNYDQVIRDIDDTTVYMNGQIAQYDQLRGIVRCPNCGAETAVGTLYCTNCGAPIAAAQQGMGPQYADQPAEPYMQQSEEQPQSQPVDQAAGQPAADAQNICPNCGKPYKPGTRFCTRCGASLTAMENEQR